MFFLPHQELIYNEKISKILIPLRYESSNELISDEDYERAKLVWKEFGCKTIGASLNTYLRIDIGMLCDVFENQ